MTVTSTTDRAEWLAWRRGGIGASDIAGILGISPWSSPFAVWAEKLNLLPDDELDDDDPREFGRRAEAMVGPWFCERTGLWLTGEQMWLTSKDEPWMLATPDALVCDDSAGFTQPAGHAPMEDVLGPLEIKTDFGKPWPEIPVHYAAQGQWQMAVGGWNRMWFAVLHGRRFRTYELERDQADIDYMIERARAFWHDHVLIPHPPEVDGSEATAAAIAAIYPDTIKGKAVDIDHVAGALDMLAEAKADAKAAGERESAAKSVLAWALKDAEVGLVAGNEVCTYKAQTRKSTCTHCGAVDESAPFRVLRTKASKA